MNKVMNIFATDQLASARTSSFMIIALVLFVNLPVPVLQVKVVMADTGVAMPAAQIARAWLQMARSKGSGHSEMSK